MRMRVILWLIIALAALLFLSCPVDSNGPEIYERIVIDTYGVLGVTPETDVDLYGETGTLLGSNEASSSVPGQIDTYNEGIPMSSGTYYIKVYDNGRTDINPYAIRVLSLSVGESLPPSFDPGSFNSSDSPYESDDDAPGNIPTNAAKIPLGNTNYLNRYLGSSSPVNYVDDDWLKLELP